MANFDLGRLEHVVVLMMENRSFDHVLGSLSLVEGRPVNGLRADFSNLDSQGRAHRVAPLAGTSRVSRFDPDVPHDSVSVALQMSGSMGGFIKAYEKANPGVVAPEQVLAYYTRQELPVTYFFADEFTLCERWLTPVPTETIPNRLYSVCGHAKSYRDNPKHNVFIDIEPIFDSLGEDWCVYAGSLPLILSIGSVAQHFQNANNIRRMGNFRRDVQLKRLPSVVWIEPVYDFAAHIPLKPFGEPNDDHPPDQIELGQQLLSDVYSALVDVPEVWEKTVLVVTYDEHGGFFDHVEPPALLPAEVQADGFKTYGPRVPAFVISPFAERGAIWSDRMDHCSVLKLICDWRGIPYLTPRVASTAIRSVADVLTSVRRTDRPQAPAAPGVPRALAISRAAPPAPSELARDMDDLRLALREEYPKEFGELFPEMMVAPAIPRGPEGAPPVRSAPPRAKRPAARKRPTRKRAAGKTKPPAGKKRTASKKSAASKKRPAARKPRASRRRSSS